MSDASPRIALARDTIDDSDVDRLIEWLKSRPRLTKGKVTVEFERDWAQAVGTEHAVFVNSGSSANLLMLYAMKVSGRLKSNQVVVPSVAWATDLAPLMQLGIEPILADVNLRNLGVDLDYLEKIFYERRPSALLAVSVLGLPPDMEEVQSLCSRYGVTLLEDTCESLGSRYGDRLLGTFGLMSTYSLYFGHHLSTVEGGMVCTDDEDMFGALKMLRSHGWDRDLKPEQQETLRARWGIDEFEALYKFYLPGFNLRATDMQAYIGLGQLEHLDTVIGRRHENYRLYLRRLRADLWRPSVASEHLVSNFAFPLLHPRRERVVEVLRSNGVEVRPLICGSLGNQPFFVERYGRLDLPNASIVDRQGCYLPNHHLLTAADIELVCELVNSVPPE
ncbi:MAG TPA: DegT/DnrJ/EryC1/StrS family aminotransferase [Solirubrobacterales bacterium]|nr:DegT/DnrJ/EryC1/StrS family aminotransferase [Solirubrobacterales bacterium]